MNRNNKTFRRLYFFSLFPFLPFRCRGKTSFCPLNAAKAFLFKSAMFIPSACFSSSSFVSLVCNKRWKEEISLDFGFLYCGKVGFPFFSDGTTWGGTRKERGPALRLFCVVWAAFGQRGKRPTRSLEFSLFLDIRSCLTQNGPERFTCQPGQSPCQRFKEEKE